MPPLAGKSKGKGREGRQSQSRHTTPSSTVSAPSSTIPTSNTAYLQIPLSKLIVPTNISYDKILERHGGSGGIPDPASLQSMAEDLKALGQLAETRSQALDEGMRELVLRRKERAEQERREAAEADEAAREAEEKERLKKLAEEEEDIRAKKGVKLKQKNDRTNKVEQRPLTYGAHGLARQDGKVESQDPAAARKASVDRVSNTKRKPNDHDSSSSLSPASHLASPPAATGTAGTGARSARISSVSSNSSADGRQPARAANMPQYQTFGPDPSTFDDPTIYHIREVTDDMNDNQKREIYGVTSFPKSDLSELVAGKLPDKDFSNAKPTNQVNANTFAAYIEPYVRLLTEEDMAWLKERGDRVGPFVIPPRGKRFYKEVWAEEDGQISIDGNQQAERLPPNQARGSLEDMDDETAETDEISNGPMMNRLLSTMRFEHRASPTDSGDKPNGITNGDVTMNSTDDSTHPPTNDTTTHPSATSMPEPALPSSARNPSNLPKLPVSEMDERLKSELRYIGFLAQDAEPDYEGHYDDEVAERLRKLQSELKEVSILNGARKARIEMLAKDRMAHQEYSTILEDLNGQVQTKFNTRKSAQKKKSSKKPGGAGGGSHLANGAGIGTAKSTINDQTRTLMNRREKWAESIGPIFDGEVTKVRGEGESVFGEEAMEPLLRAEKERWDEEAE